MESLNFSLEATSIEVTLDSANGPSTYYLKEMDSATRDKYMDKMRDRVRVDSEGKPIGIKKFEGMQAELLCTCLTDKDGNLVTKDTVQKWPASVVSQLYRKAQVMNRLATEEEEDGAKND